MDGTHWDGLRSLLPAYRQITNVAVNDGATTAFWEDNWTGGAPLCTTFPVLYSHVAKHGASVQAVAQHGLASSLVPRLSPQARIELLSAQNMLSTWAPTAGTDVRSSPLEAAGHRLCKANLKMKNVLDSDVCELCKCSVETSSHLIFGCSITQSFWRHMGWDPLRIPPAADLWQIEAQADTPSRSLPTMILLCCWNLWLHRHDVVFRRRDPSL
ncbi:hypothetical protein PVAP13_3NG178379 [Panicum virgatum]|uniref:Reverse transcriptase zinc-binding domain-containing protein n=1 Tax=Panicum virgatum TaxID=38727 RepID=A0A8T0U7V5_PANVG|nr:hypothetical protein PVAP13_3NG178379 [Panicum virgatum]